MKKKYSNELHPELSPLSVVGSLFMHVIVLAFLLTLPVYIKGNENKSLWGNIVYLIGAEEIKAKPFIQKNIFKKQTATPKNMPAETIYKKSDDKNNKPEAAALSEKTVKVQENEDIAGENMGDNDYPALKQNEGNAIEIVEAETVAAELVVIEDSFDKKIIKKDETETPQQTTTSEKAVLNENKAINPDQVKEKSSEKKADDSQQASIHEKAVLNENKTIYSDPVKDKPSEKNADSQDKKTDLFSFSQLLEALGKTDGNIDKTGTTAQRDNPLQKEENMVSEKKDLVEKDSGVKPEKPSIGLPLNESLFFKDIKVEVFMRNDEDLDVSVYLLKNPYLSLRKKHKWGNEKKIGVVEESGILTDAKKERKKIFSVAKAGEGIYSFILENRAAAPYNADILFVIYEGRKQERRKELTSVTVPSSSKLRFMFVLPEAVFWEDEDFFTGSIEDSDSITRFNDASGFIWREEKEF